jgi:hypothetical protein
MIDLNVFKTAPVPETPIFKHTETVKSVLGSVSEVTESAMLSSEASVEVSRR